MASASQKKILLFNLILIKWPHATSGSHLDGITLEPTKQLSFLSQALSHVALTLTLEARSYHVYL